MEDLTTVKITEAQVRFEQSLGEDTDPAIVVLKGHLYSENQLESLVLMKLPRGDKVLENGNLSYSQKLLLVESLDILPDNIISTLRGLNKLRNKFAHNLDAEVSHNEITRVGSPLGKKFTALKHSSKSDEKLLWSVIHCVCGLLTKACISLELKNVSEAIA